MDITIKDQSVLRGLMERRYAPVLIDIICYVAETYGFVLTESYRDKLHPNDLHGTLPVRAIDLREWCYPAGQAQAIADDINKRWIYDSQRPEKVCARVHANRKTKGRHFHIQIHGSTIKGE